MNAAIGGLLWVMYLTADINLRKRNFYEWNITLFLPREKIKPKESKRASKFFNGNNIIFTVCIYTGWKGLWFKTTMIPKLYFHWECGFNTKKETPTHPDTDLKVSYNTCVQTCITITPLDHTNKV